MIRFSDGFTILRDLLSPDFADGRVAFLDVSIYPLMGRSAKDDLKLLAQLWAISPDPPPSIDGLSHVAFPWEADIIEVSLGSRAIIAKVGAPHRTIFSMSFPWTVPFDPIRGPAMGLALLPEPSGKIVGYYGGKRGIWERVSAGRRGQMLFSRIMRAPLTIERIVCLSPS